jgi:uncharacterized protein
VNGCSPIERRRLGTTDVEVSALGIGSSAFRNGDAAEWAPLVEEAVDAGVTYFDTARSYVNGEDAIGLLPPSVRDRLVVTTKTGARGGSLCLRDLEASLRTMRRSHSDVWMTHMVETEDEYAQCIALGGFCDIAVAARDAGLVRATGASFHASTSVILRAIEDRAFDVVMFPFNLIGRETVIGSPTSSYRDVLLPAAHANGVGIVVMKVLAGGEMKHGAPRLASVLDDTALTEQQVAIRYAVSHPGIDVAVVGMTDIEELCAGVAAASDSSDWQRALRWGALVEEIAAGPCTRCGACIGVCPEQIEIPKVFRIYDQARHFGMVGAARFKYGRLDTPASACRTCRACTAVCPEDFDIAELLADAHRELAA